MKRYNFITLIVFSFLGTLLLGCDDPIFVRIPPVQTAIPTLTQTIQNTQCHYFSGDLSDYLELHRGQALLVVQTETEIVVENVSNEALSIRISFDSLDPFGKGEGEGSCINRVAPGSRIGNATNERQSAQIWGWDEHTNLVEELDLSLSNATSQSMNTLPTPTVSTEGHNEDKELYRGSALLVFQTDSQIIIENISGSPMAIRISFDGCNPHGLDETGPECDNFINNWVTSGMRIDRPITDHRSVQVWAWGEDGKIKDSCNKNF